MTGQYSPKGVIFTYGGNILTGYADGDFYSAKRTSDSQSLIIGADGGGCFIKSSDKSGEVTVTLLRSSKSNDVLSALFKVQEVASVPQPIWAEDTNGTTIVSGAEALIKKMPDLTFGKEMSDVEWVFVVVDLDIFIGGAL